MRTETDFLGNEMTFDCMGCDIIHYAKDHADDATRQETLATIDKVRAYFEKVQLF